jgi:hypothetical protein
MFVRKVSFLAVLVALLALFGGLGAAPAPDPDPLAKEKLEVLRKRLPRVVSDWVGNSDRYGLVDQETMMVKTMRRISDSESRITFEVRVRDEKLAKIELHSELLTIYLRYYDGFWTTNRFEATWEANKTRLNKSARFLMEAIDECQGD